MTHPIRALAALALLTLFFAGPPASALVLVVDELHDFASLGGPEGLAFGNENGTDVLYVSQGDDCNPCTVTVVNAATGASLRTFSVPFNDVRGLDLLPNGNLLISSVGDFFNDNRIREIQRTGASSGAPVTGGIDFTVPDAFQPESVIALSIAAGNNQIIVLDEEGTGEQGAIHFFQGALNDGLLAASATSFLGSSSPYDDPSGGVVVNGDLWTVDDSSGASSDPNFPFDCCSRLEIWDIDGAGSGTLLDFTGEFSAVTANEGSCGPLGCSDPEGLAYDAATGRLFVAFEDQGVIGVFTLVPEPSLVLLAAVAAGAQAFAAARRRTAA